MTNTLFDLVDVGQRVEALEAGFSGGGGGGGGGSGGGGASGFSGYSGAAGVIGYDGASGFSGYSGRGLSWVYIDSNTVAVAYRQYICDTSSGSFTLTLPASPVVGDVVAVTDGSDFRVNSLTVARNGAAIEGYSQDVVIDIQNILVNFIFDGTQWQVSATAGPSGDQGLSGYSGTVGSQGISGYSGVNSGGEIFQTVKSENYTTTYNDIGKHIFHPGTDSVTPRTFTIAANSSVAYPIGTTLTFVNHFNASTVFITIGGTDTLRLAGVSGSGSTTVPRILSPNGMATALKIDTTEWILNGVNIV